MTYAMKPCPFCGSDRVTVWNIRDGQQAVCKDCKSTGAPVFNGHGGPTEAAEKAREFWNRRCNQLGGADVSGSIFSQPTE